MKKLVGLPVCSALLFSCGNDPKTAESTEAKAGTVSPAAESKDYEFADAKFVELGKRHMAYLESGDIDGWMTEFADNAVYHWNNLMAK